MKTIKYLLVAALSSAALAGCSKKDNNYTVAADNAAPLTPIAKVSFAVKTMGQNSGQLVQWNTGTITLRDIQFDGLHLQSDVYDLAEYDDKNIKVLDILNPSVVSLGALGVPFDLYRRVTFGLKIGPITNITNSAGGNSLFLSGSFSPVNFAATDQQTTRVNPVPIQIIINDPVMVSSTWLENVKVTQPNYTATFTFDVANITYGIDEIMLKRAVRTNGVVNITTTSNPNLYGIIVKNLENHMMDVQLSAGPLNGINTNVALVRNGQ